MSVIGLAAAALLAAVAVWMKLYDRGDERLKDLIVWSIALTGAGLAAGVVGKVADLRADRARHDVQWRASVRSLLRECPGGSLPRLSQLTDAALGVTPTRYSAGDAPYVARPAADQALAGLLKPEGPPFAFVLVVGREKSGKSRTAAQAARVAWAKTDPPILLPLDGKALADLVALDPPLRLTGPTPVWMDAAAVPDLNALSGPVLEAVAGYGPLVVTMTAATWNEIENGGPIAIGARQALERAASPVFLEFEMTEAEKADARRLYPSEEITASIAETLVGGSTLLKKYWAGPDEQPVGCAIVRAAVDMRRAGLTRPVTRAELQALISLYWSGAQGSARPVDDVFDAGLEWAAKPVASEVALITGVSGGWQVLGYVAAADDGENLIPPRRIPSQLWTEILTRATPEDAAAIGVNAYLRGEAEVAVQALRKAALSGHPDAPFAAVALGIVLSEQGDRQGAKEAYQMAQANGVVPGYQLDLGVTVRTESLEEGQIALFLQPGEPIEITASWSFSGRVVPIFLAALSAAEKHWTVKAFVNRYDGGESLPMGTVEVPVRGPFFSENEVYSATIGTRAPREPGVYQFTVVEFLGGAAMFQETPLHEVVEF
ncbi:tetratricopeptide repeat protein [Paractinoplanes brasiliensis]|uniref:tetratricopeptide repeat protein n=1 Tax=Paractinoplanes brasiliensis TaxID=52695 RepID=UPI00105D0977|nr:hypothetical protein [Actinoplanes brasiliensis]